MNTPCATLRGLLSRDRILAIPTVYDCLSARLAEQAGFDAIFSSGFGISAARLGLPDHGYVTATEMLDSVRAICGVTRVPLVADLDTGYGNARNVKRTVTEALRAGVGGVILEDQVWPKRCGHFAGKQVIAREEHADKIRAAVEARGDTGLVIIARTDAIAVHGIDDALARAAAYRDAGADVLFVEAPRSREELQIVADAFPGTWLMANMVPGGKTPALPAAELQQMGFRIVSLALCELFAAATALRQVYARLASTGDIDAVEPAVTFEEFQRLITPPE